MPLGFEPEGERRVRGRPHPALAGELRGEDQANVSPDNVEAFRKLQQVRKQYPPPTSNFPCAWRWQREGRRIGLGDRGYI